MVTTRIEIKEHLAEYIYGKYNDCMIGPVSFPSKEDIYHVIYDLLDENKHLYGIQYIETVAYFMRKYGIQSISEDALLKNYYRWRDKVRKKSRRRQYAKQ